MINIIILEARLIFVDISVDGVVYLFLVYTPWLCHKLSSIPFCSLLGEIAAGNVGVFFMREHFSPSRTQPAMWIRWGTFTFYKGHNQDYHSLLSISHFTGGWLEDWVPGIGLGKSLKKALKHYSSFLKLSLFSRLLQFLRSLHFLGCLHFWVIFI